MRARKRSQPKVDLLQAPTLRRASGLVHGFTTRRPQEFNLSYSVGPRQNVTANRRALRNAFGRTSKRWELVTLRQRHTDVIQAVARSNHGATTARPRRAALEREPDGARKFPGDAVITDRPGLLVGVMVADCLPILIADPQRRVVAAVHAGWRGTAQRIVEKTIGRMRLEFGCDPARMRAAIGPGIHQCCYQIGPEVLEVFDGQFDYARALLRRVPPSPSAVHWQQPLFSPEPTRENRPRPGVTSPHAEKVYLDLVEANRRQLLAAGLAPKSIWASPLCTACSARRLFSHRAEHGHTGRMMGVIGIRR